MAPPEQVTGYSLQVEDKMAMKTNAAVLIKLNPTPKQVASYTYQELSR